MSSYLSRRSCLRLPKRCSAAEHFFRRNVCLPLGGLPLLPRGVGCFPLSNPRLSRNAPCSSASADPQSPHLWRFQAGHPGIWLLLLKVAKKQIKLVGSFAVDVLIFRIFPDILKAQSPSSLGFLNAVHSILTKLVLEVPLGWLVPQRSSAGTSVLCAADCSDTTSCCLPSSP